MVTSAIMVTRARRLSELVPSSLCARMRTGGMHEACDSCYGNIDMYANKLLIGLPAVLVAAMTLTAPGTASAADEAAARALARQSNCFKCHSVDKKKDGPSYQSVAAKYRDKPDAMQTMTKHITSGEKVKFEDGHEEDHTIVKTKDASEIKNLVDWILSLR